RLLDDRRIDVVAAADDHVLDAAGEPEIAVGVEASEVARVEPAVASEYAVVVLRLEIAGRDAGSPDHDHANLVDRAFAHDPSAVELDGLDLGVREPDAG